MTLILGRAPTSDLSSRAFRPTPAPAKLPHGARGFLLTAASFRT